MSGDVEMVPAHSPSPDVSALVAAASRPVLEVPPESIAAALSALGEMAFGDSDDDDRDDVRRRVELALSTRFDSLLDTMLSIRGSTANESERVVLQATRAADVVARLARESGFRVFARSRAAAPSLRAAFAMAAFAASAASKTNEPVNAQTDDSRHDSFIEAWSAATEAACCAVASFSVDRADDRAEETNAFLAAFAEVASSALASGTEATTTCSLRRGAAARVLACASADLLVVASSSFFQKTPAERFGNDLASRVAAALRREEEPWIREALVAALASVARAGDATGPAFGPASSFVTERERSANDVPNDARTTREVPPSEDPPGPTETNKTDDPNRPKNDASNAGVFGAIRDPFAAADVAVSENVARELDALAPLLADACGFVRLAATRALARGGANARGALTKLLPNLRAADAELREATLRALESAWRDGGAARPSSKTEMTDDGDDRNDVTTLDKTDDTDKTGKKTEQDVTNVSVKTDPAVSAAAASAATAARGADAPDAAARAAPDVRGPEKERKKPRADPPEIRRAMALTAAAAADALRDPDGGVREAACELFGSLREHALHAGVVETMQSLCANDGEESVRDAAIVSLTRLGYYNPLTGRQRKTRARAAGPRFGPDGRLITRKPLSSLSRRTACEGGRHDPGLVAGRRVLLRGARARLGPREGHAHAGVHPGRRSGGFGSQEGAVRAEVQAAQEGRQGGVAAHQQAREEGEAAEAAETAETAEAARNRRNRPSR
jgi:hypothetical protein